MNRRWHTLDRIYIIDLPNRGVSIEILYYSKSWFDAPWHIREEIPPQMIHDIGRTDAILITAQSMCAKAYAKNWKKEQLWEETKECLRETYNIE